MGEKKEGVLLFFGNVPWNATAEQVNEKIKENTNLECDVRISKRGSGRSRGYATVRVTPEQAEQLKQVSEKIVIGGRAIRIEQKKRRVPRKKRPAQGDDAQSETPNETQEPDAQANEWQDSCAHTI